MRTIFIILSAAFLLHSCGSGEGVNETIFDEHSEQEILIGKCTIDGFKKEPFNIWYTDEYSKYDVDLDALTEIGSKKMDAVRIKIVLGTWCHDSQREIPRFMKILDKISFPESNYEFYCLDGKKKIEGMDISSLDIQRVPTIIVYFQDEELGRIIETPLASLEKDFSEILKNM